MIIIFGLPANTLELAHSTVGRTEMKFVIFGVAVIYYGDIEYIYNIKKMQCALV